MPVNNTVPVPRRMVVRLSYPVLGALVFLAVSAIHGAVVSDYDSRHQSVNALALAPHGWIPVANFFMLGASVLSTVPTWRRVLSNGMGATWYPALTFALGLCFLLAGCIPQDPAPGYDPAGLALDQPSMTGLLHLAAAGIAATASVALMLIVAARLSGDSHWSGWATCTRVIALLTVVCVAIYGTWSVEPNGLAGTFERLAILLPALWGGTFLHRLWVGRPFMHHPAAE